MKAWKQTHQSGRTMMETLMYLGIIASLAVALLNLTNHVMYKFKINQAVSEFRSLIKNINARYAGAADYSQADSESNYEKLVEEGTIPYKMSGTTKIVHVLQGDVIIKPGKLFGENKSYTLTFKDLQKDACVELANATWFAEGSSNLLQVSITKSTKTTPITTIFTWPNNEEYNATKHLPINLTTMSTSCDSDSEITWELN